MCYSILMFQWQHGLCIATPQLVSADDAPDFLYAGVMDAVPYCRGGRSFYSKPNFLFPSFFLRCTEICVFNPPFSSRCCSLCIKSSLSVARGFLLSGNLKGATGKQALSLLLGFWKAAGSALLPVPAGLIPVATKVRVCKCVWMLDVALKKCRLAFLVNLLKRY